jgi:hypothetical protein
MSIQPVWQQTLDFFGIPRSLSVGRLLAGLGRKTYKIAWTGSRRCIASSTEFIERLPLSTQFPGIQPRLETARPRRPRITLAGRSDKFEYSPPPQEIPENVRLFANDSPETKEKLHKLWKV